MSHIIQQANRVENPSKHTLIYGEDENVDCDSNEEYTFRPLLGGPRQLESRWRPSSFWTAIQSFVDFLDIVIPLLSIALIICVALLNKQHKSEWGEKVVETTRITPTVWPILFALIVGNTMKMLARFKAERGTTMGELEHVLGSVTMTGTIKTAFSLRSGWLLAIWLTSLWAFSPLGGQASLRMLTLKDTIINSTTELSFHTTNTTKSLEATRLNGVNMYNATTMLLRTLYGSAMFSPDAGLFYTNDSTRTQYQSALTRLGGNKTFLTSTVDLYGNVRMPVLDLLSGYEPSDEHAWVDVPYETEIGSYASILGTPIRNLNTTLSGNFTFDMNSSYHRLTCADPLSLNKTAFETWYNANALQVFQKAPDTNASKPVTVSSGGNLLYGAGSMFLQTASNISQLLDGSAALQNNTKTAPKIQVLFGSRPPEVYGSNIFNCSLEMKYVDAKVKCNQSPVSPLTCAVTSMRASPNPQYNSNATIINVYNIRTILEDYYPTIFGAWPTSTSFDSTPMEVYIEDPLSLLSGGLQRNKVPVDLSKVKGHDFENRFGLLFNTFYAGSINPSTITGGALDPYYAENATAVWSHIEASHYQVDWAWLSVFSFATALLLICGTTTTVMKYRTRGPDILTAVSSFTRDSPYFDGVSGGSTLSGPDRGRLLSDMRVKIMDVQGSGEVGRIALSSEQRFDGSPLKFGRFYD